MRHWLSVLLLCAVAGVAVDAGAARRSLRVDFGTDWGDPRACDPSQLQGALLRWRGYTLSGFSTLPVANTFCQYASVLAASNLYDSEDAPIKNLMKPGETIAAARFWFLSGTSNFPGEGDEGFQWVIHEFDDAFIVALNGPARLDEFFEWQPLAVSASTTFLKAPDGTVLWDGTGFDGAYLCFRRDGSFLGAVAAGNLASCRQGVATATPVPRVLALPDINASGTGEVAVLRGAGPAVLEIREGAGGALIREITFFAAGYEPVDAVVLPDTDANGVPEVGVLANRAIDTRGYLQVRNLSGAELPRNIRLDAGYRVLAVASAGNADGDATPDAGILARRQVDGRGYVFTRELTGDPGLRFTLQPRGFDPMALLALPDVTANGVPEYAVLSWRRLDGRGVVHVSDATAADADLAGALFYSAGRSPVALATVDDADNDGSPELALLARRSWPARTLVQLRNTPPGGTVIGEPLSDGVTWIALGAVADADANGVPEIVGLGINDADGSALVETRNVLGAHARAPIRIAATSRAIGLAPLPDYDANGVPEAGVLVRRVSDGRLLVLRRNLRGAALPFGYIFSP